jgi:hypothetical protein
MVGALKKLTLKDKVILSISFLAILAISLYLIYNKDAFKNVIEIKYPDGCIERYVDMKLMTPNCTTGRGMTEIGKKQWPQMNFSIQNITVR